MLKELIEKNRSYRRFYQDFEITDRILRDLIDLARLTSTGSNIQSLHFKPVSDQADCQKVFSALKWAGYLSDWNGPEEGEKPSAYILICNDTELKTNASYDVGLACQSILLGAVEKGLGGCMFGSVDRKKLHDFFHFPSYLEITLILALGKPKEVVVIDQVDNNDIKYWRDDSLVHHVPKRSLNDIII